MDPIEDIFNAMSVESALYARLKAHAPWGISFDISDAARFAIVVRGHCWLTGDGLEQPIALSGGDCFIAKGTSHFIVQDDLATPTKTCIDVFSCASGGSVTLGRDGIVTEVVAGRFSFDTAGGEPLMSLLPPILTIRMDNIRTHLLQSTLQLLALETAEQSMGSRLVINRLADILFVEGIRAYYSADSGHHRGWIAALSDRYLARALKALHGDIARAWSVELLAAEAGMSRSAFAQHFKRVIGETPAGYLTRWRMYRAKTLLRRGEFSLAQIANRIGYETAAAFNRAFKRLEGVTPGLYRQNNCNASKGQCR